MSITLPDIEGPLPGAPVVVKSALGVGKFSMTPATVLPWVSLTLLNSWVAITGPDIGANSVIRWGPFGYLYLALNLPTSATDDHCFTLPEGYRPTKVIITNLESDGVSGNAANLPYCRLSPDGTVEAINYNRASGFLHTAVLYYAGVDYPIPPSV